MVIDGIKEASKKLAEFDFAGVIGEVTIWASPVVGTEDYSRRDGRTVELYYRYDLCPNSANWDEKAWAEYIEKSVEEVRATNIFRDILRGKLRYTDKYVVSVSVNYASSRGCEREKLCELYFNAVDNCFEGIRVFDGSDTQISLDGVEVESSYDIIDIVCACSDVELNDFLRI